MTNSQRKPWSAESRAKMADFARRTWADPAIAARRRAGIEKARTDPAAREAAYTRRILKLFPKWAPPDLADVFVATFKSDGEFEAVSLVRRLKRERAEASQ